MWFPVWNTRTGHLYFRSRGEDFKIHYDDGLHEIVNNHYFNYFNLYASYQAQKNLKNSLIKGGVNFISKNWSLDHRVRFGLGESSETDVSLGTKLAWAKNEWSIDAY